MSKKARHSFADTDAPRQEITLGSTVSADSCLPRGEAASVLASWSQTADAQIAYPLAPRLEVYITSRNRLQARNREIAGDNQNLIAIKREPMGGLSWGR